MDVETTLRSHGFSGERLLGLARDVANDAARRAPYCSETTRHDLASYLTEVAIKETLRYDATRSGDNYSFASYVWDVLHLRVADFYRRKSEGFGDKRSGSANRVKLNADPLADLDEAVWDRDDVGLGEAIQELGQGLSDEARDTLERVGVLMAIGLRELEIAKALDLRLGDVRDRLERLRQEIDGGGGRISSARLGSPLAHASDRFRPQKAP